MSEVFLSAFISLLLLAHADISANHIFRYLFRYHWAPTTCLRNVLTDFMGCKDNTTCFLGVFFVHMDIGDMLGKFFIGISTWLIQHEEEDVETGEQCGRKVYVIDWRHTWIVPAIKRIGRREDRCTRIKRRSDTGF